MKPDSNYRAEQYWAEAGYAPSGLAMQPEIVSKFGRLYEIDDFDNKKRDKLGLPAIKTETCDMAKIMEMCHLSNGGKEE